MDTDRDNPWIRDLLKWHSHEMGGVRHPFDTRTGNPIHDPGAGALRIETSAVKHVCDWADAIGRGNTDVRWVFLVGGPGNGKSECVQAFCERLDSQLDCGGKLTEVLSGKFGQLPLPEDRVAVDPEDLPAGSRVQFAEKVGRLVLIQDASASRSPECDPAEVLLGVLREELAQHDRPQPILLCCANRGVLARALRHARQDICTESAVPRLLSAVLVASGLGNASLGNAPQPCWPLNCQDAALDQVGAACWPLDLESLLIAGDGKASYDSPGAQILRQAVLPRRWQESQECQSCSASELCPFRQNAVWLQNETTATNLCAILRHAELGMGKRWSFRDLLTLAPELIIGEWEDFGGRPPCEWVHRQVGSLSIGSAVTCAEACLGLLSHLYPYALFPDDWLSDGALHLCGDVERSASETVTGPLRALIDRRGVRQSTYMRSLLREQLTPMLDPYLDSPHQDLNVMSQLEDAFSQSIALGNECWKGLQVPVDSARPDVPVDLALPSAIEEKWESLLESAESALADSTWMADTVSRSARGLLRQMACIVAKRSVGTRTGHHAQRSEFVAYENTIRDIKALTRLRDLLIKQMGAFGFEFDVLETLGQPPSSRSSQAILKSGSVSCIPQPAPLSRPERPGHDLPSFLMNGTSIPVTFEFDKTLRLLVLGCEAGTLPSSVRGLLDRARQTRAGLICRDDSGFQGGDATYEMGTAGYSIGVGEQGRPYLKAPIERGAR